MGRIASWLYRWSEEEKMIRHEDDLEDNTEEKDLKMDRSVEGGEEGKEEPRWRTGTGEG